MKSSFITLRPFHSEDMDQILDILTSERINKTYMLPDFTNREDAIPLFQRLVDLSANKNRFVRCIVLDGTAVGIVNETDIQNKTVELGYAIHPGYQNQGIMTKALRMAMDELFACGYREVICGAFSHNKASIRVMEKCGMIPTKKTETIPYRGKEHSCVYYAMRAE